MIGKILGHYEIIEKIGKGGMGEVYRARDTKLDRDVALKILPADTARDTERVHRFEREAKAVAALKHPNIVTIHSVEEIDDRHFLTMELVEGKMLSDLVPTGGFPLDRFFDIAIPLADALSSAHARGITHRDLKPSNIMLDQDGRVKVLDFGLAKLFAPPDTSHDATVGGDENVTEEGKILGTVSYMSPEQAEGKALDHRTDIFSLGVVLYEMATGEKPFQGDTPISTISSILKEAPRPVTARKATLPRHLGRVIGRCLEKNPDKRFQTARDVCNEFEGLQKEVESGDVEQVLSGSMSRDSLELPALARRRSPWPWLGIVAVVVAAAAYLVFFRGSTSAPDRTVTTRPMTSLVGSEISGSWSPDGGFFAYAHSDAGPMDIFIVSSAGGDPMRLVESPSDDMVPRWSPDNRWIAFASNRDNMSAIYLVAPLGGPVQKLADTGIGPMSNAIFATLGASPWSKDGQVLYFTRRDADERTAIWTIDLETRTEKRLSDPPRGEFDIAASVSFSGDEIVFCRSDGVKGRLLVMPAAGGEPREIHTEEAEYLSPTWSPDGNSILYAADTGGLWIVDVDSGKRRQLTTGTTEGAPVVSPDGRILFATFSHQTDLYVQDVVGDYEKRLTHHTLDNFGPRFSPDAKKVVYTSTRTGDAELWLLDMESGSERQLTQRAGGDWSPDWSPDGRQIVFSSDHGGTPALWVVSVEGGAPRKLADSPHGAGSPLWSPDGTVIGFLATVEGGSALHVVESQGGETRKILDNVGDFGWYRDSRHVVYTPSATEAVQEIRVADLQSGEESVLLETPHRELSVAADGSALSYCSSMSHFNMNLHVLRLETSDGTGLPRAAGAPEKVTHGDGLWHVHNGGWSPDGRQVIFTRDTDTGDVYVLDGAF